MRSWAFLLLGLLGAALAQDKSTVKASNSSKASKVSVEDQEDGEVYPPLSYDKNKLPSSAGPVSVSVAMEIKQWYGVSDVDGTTDLDIVITLVWTDKALKWDVRESGMLQRRVANANSSLWIPGIDIVNQKSPYIVTKEAAFVKGDTGTVELKRRILVKAVTAQDFSMYPFDKHVVKIEIESFFYAADQVIFTVDQERCKIPEGLDGPKYRLLGFTNEVTMPADTETGRARFTTGIPIARKNAGVVTMAILPAAAVTLVSFSQFYMDLDRLETRSFISTTCFLGILIFQATVNANLPAVAYVTYMHWYLTLCMMLTFLTVMEQTLVHYMDTHKWYHKSIPTVETYLRMITTPVFLLLTILFIVMGVFS